MDHFKELIMQLLTPLNISLGIRIFPFKTITCFASSVHIAEDSMKTLHIKYKNLLHIHPLTTVCIQWVPVSKQLPALHKQHEHIVAAADRNLPQWADSVLHSAVATRAQTNSHIFSLLFSSVNTQAKDGRVKQRGFGGTRFIVQVQLYYRQTHWQL